MRVLIASVVRQTPPVLDACLTTLGWQGERAGMATDFLFVDDNEDRASRELLRQASAEVLTPLPKPDGALYGVDEATHQWSVPTFQWLAREKERILEHAAVRRYDAVLLVDSDLLLSPDTLASLLGTGKEVVAAVFWTAWQPGTPALPQVWLSHPYGLGSGRMAEHEFLGALSARRLIQVLGLGACTLIRAGALPRAHYWPPIPNLPAVGMWQGEDRHFAVTCARNHIPLWADAWPDVFHVYRPSDQAAIPYWLNRPERLPQEPAQLGDDVSFTIEPLEDPALAGHIEHVRGRFGAVRVLPEIEASLSEMRIGEDRFVTLTFPPWYELRPYAGQRKLVRIRLLGAKPHAPHPGENASTGALVVLRAETQHVPEAVRLEQVAP